MSTVMYKVPKLCYVCNAPTDQEVTITPKHESSGGGGKTVTTLTLQVCRCQECSARLRLMQLGNVLWWAPVVILVGLNFRKLLDNPALALGGIVGGLVYLMVGASLLPAWLGLVDRKPHRLATADFLKYLNYGLTDEKKPVFANPEYREAFQQANC